MQAYQYNSLKDIDDCHELTAADEKCFAEIKQVLERNGMLERFGVALLHRHFDLAADECVVEYTDKDNRELKSVVEKVGETSSMETMWRFDTEDASLCFTSCSRRCAKWGSSHDRQHTSSTHYDSI